MGRAAFYVHAQAGLAFRSISIDLDFGGRTGPFSHDTIVIFSFLPFLFFDRSFNLSTAPHNDPDTYDAQNPQLPTSRGPDPARRGGRTGHGGRRLALGTCWCCCCFVVVLVVDADADGAAALGLVLEQRLCREESGEALEDGREGLGVLPNAMCSINKSDSQASCST